MPIQAYAAHQAGGALERWEYEPKDLAPYDVEIDISHCGICHSDLHMLDNDWGISQYPLVPGHEIIGTVTALGEQVTHLKVGQRVGVGWQRSACLNCDVCAAGHDQLCPNSSAVIVGNYGGFAERIRTDSRFAFAIPDALSSENAAPLLCAGVTVYSPLSRLGHSAQRVGVVGIGGLGHLAVQFAAKMGMEVTAFSSTPAKADEARELGASNVINSRDDAALKAARYSLDMLVVTVHVSLNWRRYLQMLRPNGTLCFVGAVGEPMQLSIGALIDKQYTVTGSSIGSRATMREMLDFAARHGVTAWTETLPMDDVNTALERLRRNDVRYRFVLEA